MSPTTHHCSACAASRRHKHRRPCRRPASGQLFITSLDFAARLLDEGVPDDDLDVVAAEVERCIRFVCDDGDDVLVVRLRPWTVELIGRYGDKLCTLLMTTRGKVDR